MSRLCGFLKFMLNKESPGETHNMRLLLHLLDSDSTCLERGPMNLHFYHIKLPGDANCGGHVNNILSNDGLGHQIYLKFKNDLLCT